MSRELSPEEDEVSDWLMDYEPELEPATHRLLEELKPHLPDLPEPVATLVEYLDEIIKEDWSD